MLSTPSTVRKKKVEDDWLPNFIILSAQVSFSKLGVAPETG